MTARITALCWEPVQAHQALTGQIWPALKAHLIAGHRMEVEVRREKRSSAENAMLHALLGQISEQAKWAGAKRDIDTWKRLLTAAWCRARGEHVELLPALDGHGVDIVFRRTSELNRAECADLIEYVLWWAADQGIALPMPAPKPLDPPASAKQGRTYTKAPGTPKNAPAGLEFVERMEA